MDDPTTPLAGLPPNETPTIHRAPSDAPRERGFAPGSIVAQRYRIISLLGRGGMGEVYRADDLRLGQPVALKFLSSGDANAIEHVYHEVRIAREVTHPNVCRVHDVVEADGLRFIAMEYVDGEDLASLLRRIGRLPVNKAAEVSREIAAGVAAAHDRGIIHRDLKPGNVMIDGRGRAHITDFGLASLADRGDDKIAGTPAYMAPEQVRGEQVTLRSDVYALGLVFYEIFTGERLYDSGSFIERRRQVARAPRNLSSIVRDIDPAIDRVIVQCLEEDPALRPPSARAVLAMLPGGDPLDAALAAGETPSPEMVAAASESGELPLRVVAPLAIAIVVALVFVVMQADTFLANLVRKPPEVLMDRASDVVTRAGESSTARDETYRFESDVDLALSKWGHVPRAAIAAMRPGVVRFVYRRAPSRLVALRIGDTISTMFIFRSGQVTIDDPPVDTPGNAGVVLDQNGALVEFRLRPSPSGTPVNYNALLQSTGIDLATLQPAPVAAIAPVASTERVAWNARYPRSQLNVHIEAASLNGRPSWLRVYGPWHAFDAQAKSSSSLISPDVSFVMMIVSFTGGILLAVRSLRRGRSDRRGAMRMAQYVFSCLFLSWLFAAHHAGGGSDEARMLSHGMGEASASALVVWFCYIALEPGARRRWPRLLIGWTRLLAGRLSDPMVGRETLFGIGGAIIGFEVFWFGRYGAGLLGGAKRYYIHAETLDPLRVYIGNVLLNHVEAIEIAIGTIFLMLLFTLVFRKPVIAYAAWVLLLLASAATFQPLAFFCAVQLFIIMRAGLLAGAVMGATVSLLFLTPFTFDASAWFFTRGLFVLMLVTFAALWAGYTALGSRRAAVLS